MTPGTQTRLLLTITVNPSVTVLPRCTQILSRRGYQLMELHTEILSAQEERLRCVVHGPTRWHTAIPVLLLKLVDVTAVETEETSE